MLNTESNHYRHDKYNNQATYSKHGINNIESHKKVIDILERVFNEIGIYKCLLEWPAYYSRQMGDISIAYIFESKTIRGMSPQLLPSLGVINSACNRERLQIYSGTTLAHSGAGIVFSRISNLRHSKQLAENLKEEITNAVINWEHDQLSIVAKMQALKRKVISRKKLDSVAMKLARLDILPYSKLKRIDSMLKEISSKESEPLNYWNLLNAFSYMIGQCSPRTQIQRLYLLYSNLCSMITEPLFQ